MRPMPEGDDSPGYRLLYNSVLMAGLVSFLIAQMLKPFTHWCAASIVRSWCATCRFSSTEDSIVYSAVWLFHMASLHRIMLCVVHIQALLCTHKVWLHHSMFSAQSSQCSTALLCLASSHPVAQAQRMQRLLETRMPLFAVVQAVCSKLSASRTLAYLCPR
jgi:hypothetical protein